MHRDSIGRYKSQVLHPVKRFIIRIAILLIVAIVAFILVRLYIVSHPVIKTVTNTITLDTSKDMFASKIDNLEKSVVEQVRKCESGSYKESDGLVTYDPQKGAPNNDKAMSYGTLQFKKATVIYYYKTLYQKSITGKEAILIALDDKLSGKLAQDIMFKSNNLANDWYNCSNKLSLSETIKAIKNIK